MRTVLIIHIILAALLMGAAGLAGAIAFAHGQNAQAGAYGLAALILYGAGNVLDAALRDQHR